MQRTLVTSFALMLFTLPSVADTTVDRSAYLDKLRGFWLGVSIANWTGLPTENDRTDFPFYTDDDFGPDGFDYVLDPDPWGADDDSDIEYVYQHAIEQYGNYKLTGEQISQEWQDHIALPRLWVSNLAALGQMQNGAIPPDTSLPENNPMWDMIDAQLTTEIFGAFAPTRPDVALDLAYLPIRTTAYLHAEWAAEFYVIMHSLAASVDRTLSPRDQVMWMADQARQRIPNWSYIADMYDFVKAEYLLNPDKNNWEETRDKVAIRYQRNGAANYEYKYPWDAGINFAASIVSLLYGEGDYKKTIRIGAMSGWDSDNPTATWGGLLGLLNGYEALNSEFPEANFSDRYNIARTRFNMPIEIDSFTDMSRRGLAIIDDIVVNEMGGMIDNNSWIIPDMPTAIPQLSMPETTVDWKTIEDSDPRWNKSGFETLDRQWNASGATLTFGYENCSAEISFEGTAIIYYGYRSSNGGAVNLTLDDVNYGSINQFTNVSEHGQHYIKLFEKHDLDPGQHSFRVDCDFTEREKTIDMLSIR